MSGWLVFAITAITAAAGLLLGIRHGSQQQRKRTLDVWNDLDQKARESKRNIRDLEWEELLNDTIGPRSRNHAEHYGPTH